MTFQQIVTALEYARMLADSHKNSLFLAISAALFNILGTCIVWQANLIMGIFFLFSSMLFVFICIQRWQLWKLAEQHARHIYTVMILTKTKQDDQ